MLKKKLFFYFVQNKQERFNLWQEFENDPIGHSLQSIPIEMDEP